MDTVNHHHTQKKHVAIYNEIIIKILQIILKHDHTEYHFAFSISEGNYLLKVSDDNSLLVDCGATAHIINNDSLFVSVDEGYKPEEHFIELADGSRSNNVAKKRGTALVNIQDEHGNVRESTLNNALYVPSYPQNIFSVQAATEHGAKINFSSDHAEIISKNGVKFPIQKRGRLYYLYKSSVENVR